MKSKVLKLSLVFLLFALIGVSCQDDEDLFEIQIGDENAIIQKTVDGIEFKFCLLNEQGEPTTVFNEGENFSFQLSITNNTEEELPFWDLAFYDLDDFLAVSSSDVSYGKPFKYLGSAYTPISKYLPPYEEHYILTVPWHDERDVWSYFWAEHESTMQPLLSKGKYYTQFAYTFEFRDGEYHEGITISPVRFKINFEIKTQTNN